jgi:single-strand DNA-binding protein
MANDLNKVVLIGRCVADAQMKYTNGGLPVARFAIAVNRRKKSGDTWSDEANFFDIVLLGKSAESIAKYLTKGKQVGVEGELHQDRWEQEGQTRSRVEVVASNVQLLGGGKDSGRGQAAGQSDAPAQSAGEFEDEIPF